MATSDVPDDGLSTDGVTRAGSVRLIRVVVDEHLAELVSDRFWQVGVRGVTETALDDGRVEVSSSVGDDQDSIERTVATFDPTWTWRVDEVDATPADTWRQFAEPIWFRSDRVLIPAWLETDSVQGVDAARSVTLVEPGSAFGLGDHPTTRSSLQLLAATLDGIDDRHAASVLDVGCGTGVLAVLAAQLGVGTTRAIDVAHAAVEATGHNAGLNGVVADIEVDTTPVADIDGDFDVVVANILAPVLVAIADDLRRLTAPGGTLIVSGMIEHRHDHVLAALAPLKPVDTLVDDGWITVALRH